MQDANNCDSDACEHIVAVGFPLDVLVMIIFRKRDAVKSDYLRRWLIWREDCWLDPWLDVYAFGININGQLKTRSVAFLNLLSVIVSGGGSLDFGSVVYGI